MKCIRCGKEMEYDVCTPAAKRSCYDRGSGQMCLKCFCEVHHVPVLNGIYYFKRVSDGGQIQPIKCELFTAEEVDRIQDAALVMDRLFGNLNRSIAADEAFKEFKVELKKPNSENPYELAEVDRRFRAFIFEWKLFTEHWKNYINGMNGDTRYISDYKQLYKDTMNAAFQKSDFVIAHVIRNYISHANDAIDAYHIGAENKFWIHKHSLLSFIDNSISNVSSNATKNKLQAQRAFIEACAEEIDLELVADGAMRSLREIQDPLMNMQLDQETIDSCLVLLEAKKKIKIVDDEVWEIWKPVHDPSMLGKKVQTTDIQANVAGMVVNLQYGHIRLNWIGYEATASFTVRLWKESMNN